LLRLDKFDGRALLSAYRRWGFARVTLVTFMAMDVAFKLLVVTAFLDLLPVQVRPPRALAAKASGVALAAFLGVAFALARSAERWLRVPEAARTPDVISRCARALRTFPSRMAVVWAAHWVCLIGSFVLQGVTPSATAAVFFVVTMATGPLPLAHGLCVWLASPIVRDVSLTALARGVDTGAPPRSLRWRLTVYALFFAFVPTFYMAAVTFAARESTLSNAHLLTTVLLFFSAIALFALLCAVLLAATITGPVAEMARVIRNIILQGDVSQAGSVPVYHRDEVGALAGVTNEMVSRLERAEREQRAAAESLARLNRDLELRVERRTHELTARNNEMRLVFDSVEQGLFTIDGSGRISSQYSAVLARWFGAPEPEEPFYRFFGRVSASVGASLEVGWLQVEDGALPLAVALDQLPKRFQQQDRHYRLQLAAIGGGASAGQFLGVVSDVTRDLEHEALQRGRKETLALFERTLDDRLGLIGFLAEGSALLETIAGERDADQDIVKRALHTLKGSSALFGLESVAALCHELESEIAEEARAAKPARLGELEARWAALREEAERLLGARRNIIELSAAQHHELENAVAQGAGNDQLLDMLRRLRLEPAERRLVHLGEYARQLGERLGKRLQVAISHDSLRLDSRRYAAMWAALQHALRNAVDHGLEPAAARVAENKPEVGRIDLRARQEAGTVVIEVEDDGRGIAWDQLRQRIELRGGATLSQRDLVLALFGGGVSTSASVSDVSGRGLGMSALKAAVDALGGDLDLASTPRRGTCLRLTIPAAPLPVSVPQAPPSTALP
jgi:HPt (histidine-containing phosphotransfer) domain-containing protein/HAMP domain-containing protein